MLTLDALDIPEPIPFPAPEGSSALADDRIARALDEFERGLGLLDAQPEPVGVDLAPIPFAGHAHPDDDRPWAA